VAEKGNVKVRMRKGLGKKEDASALYGKVTDRENVGGC
jgi:hypothetical protein